MINSFYLSTCDNKIVIGDLRYGRRDMVLLKNKTLQDTLNLAHGLGTPIAWEESGRVPSIIRTIEPKKGQEETQTAYGSCDLEWHTENVSHIRPPNFVILFCVKKDRNNEGITLLSHVDDIKFNMSRSDIQALHQPIFDLHIEDTLLMDDGDSFLGTVPIFQGDDMYYDAVFMKTKTPDIISRFESAIKRAEKRFLLEPGDVLIFNNTRFVHSRTSFQPYYDGNDRTLNRILVLDTYNPKFVFTGYRRVDVKHDIINVIPTNNKQMRRFASHDRIYKHQTKRVAIFQVEGGLDKHDNPHRREIKFLLKAFRDRDIYAEVVFYRDSDQSFFDYIRDNFDVCMTRINPEKYPDYTESLFLNVLSRLEDAGVICLPSAKTIVSLDHKDIVYHIRNTIFGLPDTKLYTNRADFNSNFASTNEKRVLKMQHQAEGRGVYLVDGLSVTEAGSGCSVNLDNLGNILFSVEQNILDQRFLPRIHEAEIRIVLVGDQPLYVVLFVPTPDEWLAFGDGQYYPIPQFPNLRSKIQRWIPELLNIASCPVPLLWSADFILKGERTGKKVLDSIDSDELALSEINCSCLGFKQNETQPDLSLDIVSFIASLGIDDVKITQDKAKLS
jgi:hypothetical protein